MANGVSNLTGKFDKKAFLEDCKKQMTRLKNVFQWVRTTIQICLVWYIIWAREKPRRVY